MTDSQNQEEGIVGGRVARIDPEEQVKKFQMHSREARPDEKVKGLFAKGRAREKA